VPTANERKALWFLAAVALSGSAVRLSRSSVPRASAGEIAALDHQIRRADSAGARTKEGKGRPNRSQPKVASPTPTRLVDLDRATAAEIEALPGIGPALAARVVAHRDSVGPFGVLEALCDVRGIGPALAERLRPLVTFSGPRRPLSVACGEASKSPRKPRN
jgi:competence protein ComEA